VLYDFLATNRQVLIDRCRIMGAARHEPKNGELELTRGIPVFLDQLIATLKIEQGSDSSRDKSNSAVGEMAKLHGHDLFARGFTIEQVVRDYGDVCQAVTNLAFETGAPIAVDEFRTFNRCLDNAIAGAVTAYTALSAQANVLGVEALNSRLGPLAHELRNYLHTAMLVVAAIKRGNVGTSGATGAILDRSLQGMRNLIDRALAEVRVTASIPRRREVINLANFLGSIAASAEVDARARGIPFTTPRVADGVTVYADSEMLAAAVGNLLSNAFKFTRHHTEVRLRAHAAGDRVLIDVEDHCGGLPLGDVEKMFLPYSQAGDDRSGLGLGLDISRRGVEANDGVLRVRDVPGVGCVFTIDLPIHSFEPAAGVV
jgi:signal transduction histidine kinase